MTHQVTHQVQSAERAQIVPEPIVSVIAISAAEILLNMRAGEARDDSRQRLPYLEERRPP